MITFEKFKNIFLYNTNGGCCIEIELVFKENSFFAGKTADGVYWCGAPYSFESDNADEFLKFIGNMRDGIEVVAIDGCDPDERIEFYLNS